NVRTTKSVLVRILTVSMFVGIVAISFIIPITFLSLPRPTSLEWAERNLDEAEVLHASMVQDEGIYVLLKWNNKIRYYVIAWDQDLAENLQQAMDAAEQQKYEQ